MTSLVIYGDTSGSITLSANATAGTNTLTFPNNTGTFITTASSGQSIPSLALPIGTVLQVVNAKLTGFVSTSTSTYADTGLTVNITPKSATSKILITAICSGCSHDTNPTALQLQLVRNSTVIVLIEDYTGNPTGTSGFGITGASGCTYLDSPATTSATTYKIQFASRSNNGIAGMNNYGSVNSVTSTITVMEVAA